MIERSTIVGVATGTADGGVAIVRLSGPRAHAIASALGVEPGKPRRLQLRALIVGGGVEQALVVAMPGPASYTGEDVVELHVHAGSRNVEQIVRACVAAGCVPAEPGAFTRRAFEHGRMSLEQAEGVAALIGAKTQAAVDLARRLIGGELGRDADVVCERIAELRAEIEARLDFPEDVDAPDVARWQEELAEVTKILRQWQGRYDAGARARTRPRVVLAGPPNAGKSSLFNALVGYARAIVAPQPGTTRDYVEAEVDFGDTACVVVDTAGIRDASDAIERAGVERSHEQVAGADHVLWLEAGDAAEEIALRPSGLERGITVEYVETKRDLGERRPSWRGVSSQDAASVEALRTWLQARVASDATQAWIGLLRHRDATAQALVELEAASLRFSGLELVAFHLGLAQARLGEIRGRSSLGPVGEDVLRRIFERFCIGK